MNQQGAGQSTSFCSLVLIDADGWRVSRHLDEDAALTFFAVASEDPTDWMEVVAYWPRYRTPVVAEFAESFSIGLTSEAEARALLAESDRWLVIDLTRKRIVSGRGFVSVGRNQVYDMDVDEKGKAHWPMSIHLPPWWELLENTEVEAIDHPRSDSLHRPQTNREVLYGSPMMEDLAKRILDCTHSQRWIEANAATDPRQRYRFTVEVHRDWLMTPREDLGGKTPRDMLHGAADWIEHLAQAQRLRFEDGGEVIAAPTDVADFESAPMGREEICVYFDLCRAIIEKGWLHCRQMTQGTTERVEELRDFLKQAKETWLNEPFEEGSPPRFILECSRRRVPRGCGVKIAGMDEREPDQHVVDCNCPICEMMADGLFGVAFCSIDGHHLELDDEFAFSLYETREEWEELRYRYDDLQFTRDHAAPESVTEESVTEESASECLEIGDSEIEAFSSSWGGIVSEEPIPGDTSGHLKLAFLLAEIVSVLGSLNAPSDTIGELNASFREFRQAGAHSSLRCGHRLKTALQEIAAAYPQLVSRAADLESRIDESLRQKNALG